MLNKNLQNWSKGAWPRSRDLLVRFWDRQNISKTDAATNFKFGVLAGHKTY